MLILVKGEKWACSTLKAEKNKPNTYITKNGICEKKNFSDSNI